METIEFADLTLTEIPPDVVLYNEVLCEKINSKFKKVKVVLRRSSTIDGTPVYNFELGGKDRKNHLAFDFDAKDLCFMRCEEKQENVHEPSCFSCLNRNFYPNIVYTRLIMMWYSMNQSSGEASCIKVPLMQQGNAYAATALKRLESIVYSRVVGADKLKHWQVLVLQCGAIPPGSRMFLALTGYALVLLHDHSIVAYHDLLENDFGICYEESNILHIAVTRKVQSEEVEEENVHANFTLSTTYVFQTPHAKSIEASLLSLQKHSENQSSLPLPHFNIRHRETSNSGVVPGTASDNFSVVPFHTNPAFAEDSYGSHSNGHIPNDPRTFSDNVVVHSHPSPPPHFQGMSSSGSNGTIPGSDSATFTKEIHQIKEMHVNPNIFSGVEMNNNEILVGRGCSPDPKIMNVTMRNVIKAERPQTIGKSMSVIEKEEETKVKQCPSPPRGNSSLTPAKELCDSSPVTTTAFDTWKRSRLSSGEADLLHHLEDNLDFVEFDFEIENDLDLSLQTPPTPCGNIAHVLQEFRYKPPAPLPKSYTLKSETDNDKYIHPLPRRPKPFLMRAHSMDLLDHSSHLYVNVELQSVQMRNALDDTNYFRFYYNTGFVRMMDARMSKKIERRSRLSSHIDDVDFNLLDKHEQWFDRCYKSRDKDLKFLRITKMNIPVSPSPSATGMSPYSRVKPDEPAQDDPYWSSDLSITIQAKLQDRALGVGETFDLTQEQLIEIQVLLSLVPAQSNWRDLAEHIGLVSEDISVIEHFCYTYKHLAAEIVLAHWVMQEKRGKLLNKHCTRENLLMFLQDMGRDDILSHIKASSRRENEQIQTRRDMNDMINVIENTRL